MTRRNLELVLLCIAAPLVILLFACMAVNQGLGLNFNTLGVPLGIFAAFVLAHLAVRKFAPAADPALLPIVFALSGIGIAFVTRLAPDLASKQLIWLFVGVACMVAILILLRNIERLARYKYTLMIIGFVLLLSPLIPGLGQEIYGSRIWLSIGGFSFQPGELAKIIIVLFLAAYLAHNREMLSVFTWQVGPVRLPDLPTLLPLLIMWGISIVIVIFEKDLGSALVFYAVFLAMLYFATGKKFYVVVGLVLAAVAAVFLYVGFAHVQTRVQNWLDPFADPLDAGYQMVQALYSMADGGLVGTGIGRGMADQIPVVESDFIFAAIAEEAGLLGAAGVLLLFLSFCVRGFVTAARAKSDVASFVAAGCTATVGFQSFIIVGGVTGLIPLTGLTLPFVSQGGSSLLAGFIIVGLLLICGNEGTGVEAEMTLVEAADDSVLGRMALGKRLTHGMVLFSVLFAVLIANLTLIMVVRADYYQNLSSNNHTIARESNIQRGTISTADGTVLAQSVKDEDGDYVREYPAGSLASHVVGYVSTRFGTSGIEAAYNDTLKGESNYATWSDALNALSGSGTPGNDVVLTIDTEVQQAAQDALADKAGACVVIQPETGAVLALASAPTYEAANVEDVLAASAAGDDTTQLYNRATQALYAPGSTFKIVTLTAALENNVATEATTYESPGSMEIGGQVVTNFDGNNYGTITLARATELSSNTVFGQVGVQMGASTLVDAAAAFGFGTALDFALPVSTSLMPDADEMTEWELAWAAAGEPVGEHESPAGPQVTVLQMALVGCGIANDGTIMNPYLVDSIFNASGQRSFTATATTLCTATDSATATRVRNVLKGVVENGTGWAAALDGVTVAGKTGTAEKEDSNDIWFVGMAPAENPTVVVAIVLEDGDEGTASLYAQNVLKVALEQQGTL